jgi:hypothetical protein
MAQLLHHHRYLLRVTVTGKGMVTDTKRDVPFWVRNYELPPDEAPPIKMEVWAWNQRA